MNLLLLLDSAPIVKMCPPLHVKTHNETFLCYRVEKKSHDWKRKYVELFYTNNRPVDFIISIKNKGKVMTTSKVWLTSLS